MLRGWEHGHIHADLTDDSDRRKGLDTRNRQNKIELWQVFLNNKEDQRFEIHFAEFSVSYPFVP